MRQLASEITSKGASIHDVLDHETKMKGQRQMVLQRNFQLDKVEALLDNQMKKMGAQMAELHEAIDNIATVEVSLDHKIDKKNQELERLRKRLDTMKNIRYQPSNHQEPPSATDFGGNSQFLTMKSTKRCSLGSFDVDWGMGRMLQESWN